MKASLERARRTVALAHAAGFADAGVASAAAPDVLSAFRPWIERGFAGQMDYLIDQLDRRADLTVAFPWARSVVAVALPYDTPSPYSTEADRARGWISRYAWGDDYHDVVRARLETLRASLADAFGSFESRAYVDTGPVAEKAYAAAAGIGVYGKNACLLNQRLGSWFFIGVLVTDLDLEPSTPGTDICGSCRACLDACPTGAFPEPYVLDATKCISYLTIEARGATDETLREATGRHVYGCDICQDVCPWNRKRRVSGGAEFEPRDGAFAPSLVELAALSSDDFAARFRKSPVKRTKLGGLLRNVATALGNSGDAQARPALERLAANDDSAVREHARWALARLGSKGV